MRVLCKNASEDAGVVFVAKKTEGGDSDGPYKCW